MLRHSLIRLLLGSAAICSAAACSMTPSHDIPAKPEFILAGVKPGDTVVVTTKDGVEAEIVVDEVRTDAITGEGKVVRFRDIDTIAVRSWKSPEHPCGGSEPVGCSIPEVVLVLSSEFKQQAGKFHPACVTHDFCYRHGFATYGMTRERCDNEFYEDMKNRCESLGALSMLDVKDYTMCQAAALQTFEAVRRYGEKAYRTSASSYCEYR